MKLDTLNRAEAEARAFIKRCEELKQELGSSTYTYVCGSKQSAAVRRQSMELTRALADLRQNR